MGELSSARQALEGATIALGTDVTRAMLTNPATRPQEPYAPVPPHSRDRIPDVLFELDEDQFTRNLRNARKGWQQAFQV